MGSVCPEPTRILIRGFKVSMFVKVVSPLHHRHCTYQYIQTRFSPMKTCRDFPNLEALHHVKKLSSVAELLSLYIYSIL